MSAFITEIHLDDNKSCEIENGFYWVKSSQATGLKPLVLLMEDGRWYFQGLEESVSAEFITDIVSYKLIGPNDSLLEKFRESWVASGESPVKLLSDCNGKYNDERTQLAFNFFKLGTGLKKEIGWWS